MRKVAVTRVLIVVLLVIGWGCRERSRRATDTAFAEISSAPTDTVLSVQVGAGKLSAPRAIAAGWRAFRVARTDNAGHHLVAFHVDAALTTQRFLALLDSAPTTPAGATALGGPEGVTTEVVVRLPAGRLLIACVSRGDDKHRHATKGEVAEVAVQAGPLASAADSSAADPSPTDSNVVTIPLSDFAFTGAEKIPASTRFLRIRNRGLQDHQLRITRLKSGKNISDWLKDQDAASDPSTDFGVARLGTPHDALLPVSLSPGAYVFYCLITDPKSGLPHIELGMMRQINVIP